MEYCTTIGIDVSDGTSRICMMTKVNGERRVIEEKTVKTSKAGFREYLADKDRSVPIAFETGTHCRWMRDLMAGELGFRVYVANPGKLPTITKSNTKNDRNDARELARLLLADPEMLHPVELRGEAYQTMIRYAKARDAAMGARTKFTGSKGSKRVRDKRYSLERYSQVASGGRRPFCIRTFMATLPRLEV